MDFKTTMDHRSAKNNGSVSGLCFEVWIWNPKWSAEHRSLVSLGWYVALLAKKKIRISVLHCINILLNVVTLRSYEQAMNGKTASNTNNNIPLQKNYTAWRFQVVWIQIWTKQWLIDRIQARYKPQGISMNASYNACSLWQRRVLTCENSCEHRRKKATTFYSHNCHSRLSRFLSTP